MKNKIVLATGVSVLILLGFFIKVREQLTVELPKTAVRTETVHFVAQTRAFPTHCRPLDLLPLCLQESFAVPRAGALLPFASRIAVPHVPFQKSILAWNDSGVAIVIRVTVCFAWWTIRNP